MAWSSTDQQILDALKQALLDIATGGQQAASANGRQWTLLNIGELERTIAKYEAKKRAGTQRPAVSGFGTVPGGAR